MFNAFIKAVEKGDVLLVKSLLKDSSIDPSASDNFAIKIAVANGYIKLVELLLSDERVDSSVNSDDLIMVINDKEMIILLKSHIRKRKINKCLKS